MNYTIKQKGSNIIENQNGQLRTLDECLEFLTQLGKAGMWDIYNANGNQVATITHDPSIN